MVSPMQHYHDDSRKLYSVVIQEDPAEQLSPTFQAKRGFFNGVHQNFGHKETS